MVYTDGGMNTSGRELISPHNSLAGARPQTTDGGLTDYKLVGGQGPNKSGNTDACGSSKSSDNMDLLLATLMQNSAIQNRTNYTSSGTYFPLTGYEDLPPALSSQINNESHSWLLNNHSQSTSLPYQTSKIASTNNATTTSSTSGFPNGEGPSTAAAAAALDQNKLMEGKQPAALWGLPVMSDLPVLQTEANKQIPPTQNMLQQQVQVASTKEIPLFNTMKSLEGVKPQGHKATFKQLDLDLQL
ncbi:hypothetical protein P3X46_022075 [Hevea brasiliensis]|uniref:Uncharacterized protein n=1 Tax=Hevea brasiliensis TaxID=3981 RepID=A0ABQ9LLE6_HEVBR|nr:hypothetical protein P3X46_022075 [Hevea brasiliensis]